MNTASDDYEHFTQRVIDSLVGVEVHRGRTYTGRVSGRKIKLDVSFNYTIAQGAKVLFIIERKCYNHSVAVDDVEEFHSKFDDIGAHKGNNGNDRRLLEGGDTNNERTRNSARIAHG